MTESEKRQHFRLEFPPAERPRLQVGKYELVVIEVSEGGCSVEGSESVAPAFGHVGVRVAGDLVFADGQRHKVEGQVVRVGTGSRISIRFSKGLTFAHMMAEHRRIRAKYSS